MGCRGRPAFVSPPPCTIQLPGGLTKTSCSEYCLYFPPFNLPPPSPLPLPVLFPFLPSPYPIPTAPFQFPYPYLLSLLSLVFPLSLLFSLFCPSSPSASRPCFEGSLLWFGPVWWLRWLTCILCLWRLWLVWLVGPFCGGLLCVGCGVWLGGGTGSKGKVRRGRGNGTRGKGPE